MHSAQKHKQRVIYNEQIKIKIKNTVTVHIGLSSAILRKTEMYSTCGEQTQLQDKKQNKK